METTVEHPDPWAVQGIYVRMSRERKKHLLAIAKEVGHLESPVRALSAHIAASGAAIIANAENALPDIAGDGAAAQDGVHSRLDRISAALADLSDRLAGASPTGEWPAPVQSMEAWLGASCLAMNPQGGTFVLAKALWLRSERSATDSSAVHMDFEMDLLSVDNEPVRRASVGTVGISGLRASCAFATEQRIKNGPIAIACRAAKPGVWDVVAYSLDGGGELGSTIAKTRLS